MIVDRAEHHTKEVQLIANCEVVQSYVYIGSVISNIGGCQAEIKRRSSIARSAVERLTKIWQTAE